MSYMWWRYRTNVNGKISYLPVDLSVKEVDGEKFGKVPRPKPRKRPKNLENQRKVFKKTSKLKSQVLL